MRCRAGRSCAVSRWDRRSEALTWPPTWRRPLDRRRLAGLDDRRIWWSCSQHIPELRGDPTRLTDNGLKGTKARVRRRWRRRDYRSFSSARRVGGADMGTTAKFQNVAREASVMQKL